MTITRCVGRRFLDNPRALNVNWTLTRKCNYTCSYCSAYNNKVGVFHSLEQLQRAVDKLTRLSCTNMNITLSGGEPTAHPHYSELICLLVERIACLGSVLTITNLSRTPRYYESLCQRIDDAKSKLRFKASLHLEHADVDGYFENARVLAKLGVPLKLSVMAHPEKMPQAKLAYDRAQALVRDYSNVQGDAIVIQEDENVPDSRYVGDDLAWLAERGGEQERNILLEEQDDPVDVSGARKQGYYAMTEVVMAGKNRFKGMSCNAGINMLAIGGDGAINPAVCFIKTRGEKPNIYSEDCELALFAEPITCPFDSCGCLADLAIPKARGSHETSMD